MAHLHISAVLQGSWKPGGASFAQLDNGSMTGSSLMEELGPVESPPPGAPPPLPPLAAAAPPLGVQLRPRAELLVSLCLPAWNLLLPLSQASSGAWASTAACCGAASWPTSRRSGRCSSRGYGVGGCTAAAGWVGHRACSCGLASAVGATQPPSFSSRFRCSHHPLPHLPVRARHLHRHGL